jgi:hypothetical protein
MKFAVSIAIVVLLLGMPLGCILSACQPAASPCCPRTSANVKCLYDYLDSAKAVTPVAISLPATTIGIVPPSQTSVDDFSIAAIEPVGDLNILNRILRI